MTTITTVPRAGFAITETPRGFALSHQGVPCAELRTREDAVALSHDWKFGVAGQVNINKRLRYPPLAGRARITLRGQSPEASDAQLCPAQVAELFGDVITTVDLEAGQWSAVIEIDTGNLDHVLDELDGDARIARYWCDE